MAARHSIGALLCLVGVVALSSPEDGEAQSLPAACNLRTTTRVIAVEPQISPEERIEIEGVFQNRAGKPDLLVVLDSIRTANPKVLKWVLADLISNTVDVGNDVAFKAKGAYLRLFGGEAGPVLQMSEANNDDYRRGLALDAIDPPLSGEERRLVVGYACDAGAMLIGYRARPNSARPLTSAGIAEGILLEADRLLSGTADRVVVDSIKKAVEVPAE